MARTYSQLVARDGIWVPRWLIIMLIFLIAGWVGYRVYAPPTWMVQRLDSPDGQRAARLMRTTHRQDHLMVQIKEGWIWQTYHLSEPIESDYRVDLQERLRWSDDSMTIHLRVRGEPVWGFDFRARRAVPASELNALSR